jgi:hypothetical protein
MITDTESIRCNNCNDIICHNKKLYNLLKKISDDDIKENEIIILLNDNIKNTKIHNCLFTELVICFIETEFIEKFCNKYDLKLTNPNLYNLYIHKGMELIEILEKYNCPGYENILHISAENHDFKVFSYGINKGYHRNLDYEIQKEICNLASTKTYVYGSEYHESQYSPEILELAKKEDFKYDEEQIYNNFIKNDSLSGLMWFIKNFASTQIKEKFLTDYDLI